MTDKPISLVCKTKHSHTIRSQFQPVVFVFICFLVILATEINLSFILIIRYKIFPRINSEIIQVKQRTKTNCSVFVLFIPWCCGGNCKQWLPSWRRRSVSSVWGSTRDMTEMNMAAEIDSDLLGPSCPRYPSLSSPSACICKVWTQLKRLTTHSLFLPEFSPIGATAVA